MSMKQIFNTIFLSAVALVFAATIASAQAGALKMPNASQKASVTQTIGVTDVTINYFRPGVKGRKVWGDATAELNAKGEATLDNGNTRAADAPMVPYGHVWRTGANDATQFIVTDDVMINGQPLAAGAYSLHTIPGKTEWTVVFNSVANQWGSFSYDAKKDTLRVKAKPQSSPHSQEWMLFTIDPVTENSATVNILWEKIWVPFTISVDVPVATLKNAKAVLASAKSDDWRTPFRAAQYASQNKQNDVASAWFEQALKAADESIKAKETFGNLSGKANILFAMGRRESGLAVADAAIARGKADKADTASFEKRIADIRAGKN